MLLIYKNVKTAEERYDKMDFWNILTLIGGLCLFLFGMNVMGEALERRAGNRLESMLGRLTTGKMAGLLTGLGVTAIIQSSSATTVMVVGFVNSGLMNLSQAINVIMGANIGTTVTSWILSLGGIDGEQWFIQILRPANFTPILALVGVVLYVFMKSAKKRDTGMILLGFATLIFGMNTMTDAVAPLAGEEWFTSLFLLFENPILGVLVGAAVTAIIQSSSASVGILQAIAASGAGMSIGATIPIIMGQNIGTTVTALLSSVGTNKNARRAAIVHLSFNVIGTVVCLLGYWIVDLVFAPVLFDGAASEMSIAVVHSVFNIVCTAILLPASSLLAKLAYRVIPESKTPDTEAELDERLLTTPAIALERCRELISKMADYSTDALSEAISLLEGYDAVRAARVRELEEISDHYEDVIGSYLVKLSSRQLDEEGSIEVTKCMKIIGDFERISDHAVNILESAEELREKGMEFSPDARAEMGSLCDAVSEISGLALRAYKENLPRLAFVVEPLEEVIDNMKETMRTRHILRLREGKCSIEAGFVWSDLITNLERISDHCSNVSGCVLDASEGNMDIHSSLRSAKAENEAFRERYLEYSKKYLGA